MMSPARFECAQHALQSRVPVLVTPRLPESPVLDLPPKRRCSPLPTQAQPHKRFSRWRGRARCFVWARRPAQDFHASHKAGPPNHRCFPSIHKVIGAVLLLLCVWRLCVFGACMCLAPVCAPVPSPVGIGCSVSGNCLHVNFTTWACRTALVSLPRGSRCCRPRQNGQRGSWRWLGRLPVRY